MSDPQLLPRVARTMHYGLKPVPTERMDCKTF